MKLYLLHGPNLNMLGSREPMIYGKDTLEDIEQKVKQLCMNKAVEFEAFNSNFEGDMIEKIHEIARLIDNSQSGKTVQKAGFAPTDQPKKREDAKIAVIINPGAWTHYSYALTDALALLKEKDVKIIEVHISNPHAREEFRHNSVVSPNVTGVICGLGIKGYELATNYLI